VESIEYGEKWIARFENFMIFLRVFLLAVGGCLGLGLIFIVANTIKLSVYSRQDEIELMLMVGATHSYIKTPFLLEGLTQGFSGALISLIAIKLIHLQMKLQFQDTIETIVRGGDFLFISGSYVLIMFIASMSVGLLGSYVSIQQFLSAREK
jgi:cell division transport system permease protein